MLAGRLVVVVRLDASTVDDPCQALDDRGSDLVGHRDLAGELRSGQVLEHRTAAEVGETGLAVGDTGVPDPQDDRGLQEEAAVGNRGVPVGEVERRCREKTLADRQLHVVTDIEASAFIGTDDFAFGVDPLQLRIRHGAVELERQLDTGVSPEAELLDLNANPKRSAIGTVIEASLDKGRGFVTKILVQTGTLNMGDPVLAGEYSGKVKAMFNERGAKVKTAGPATPVLLRGLNGAPQAGETFKVMESDQEARQLASRRAQIAREQATRANKRISLDEIGRRLALGMFKELNLIVKGDVDGSIEALADSLIKLSIETVQVNVIHKAVGQIIESDVLLASASDAIVIGFQVRPSIGARKLAEREGVQIKTYSIIYEAIEEIKMAIEGMLEPTKEEKITAQVEVRETYKISRIGTIAACFVLEGTISRNSKIRIVRDGIVVYPTREGANGEISSLKRFKDDVKDVRNGMECGITIKNFNDIKADDIIEAYEIIEIKQKLS